MPKFIVIDHSICGLGGHYYEYARHVLEAAKDAGFEPVVATNRQFKADEAMSWRVHPVYRCGFWANQSPGRSASVARWTQKRLRNMYLRFQTRLVYSELGVLWMMRRQPRAYLRTRPGTISPFVLALLVAAACAFKTVTASAKLARRIVARAPSVLSGVTRCRNSSEAIGKRAIQALGANGWVRQILSDRSRARQFTWATRQLASREPIGAGDVVLLPTVSELELSALAEAFRRTPSLLEARWHLVFRRNVFPGSQPLPPASTPELLAMRNAFQRCADLHRNGVLSFYSDTEELSAHYQHATGLAFDTLPVPHTQRPADPEPGSLQICYLGDARTEKGFHHLPHIVGDLWRDYVKAGKLAFTIQANYNVPLGEPSAIVARGKLRQYKSDRLRLIESPLSSRDYWQVLRASGVNLLPYDRQNYFARSSGILAESLAAGVPVVVPAGTWMSRQIVDEIYRHRLSLGEQMQVVKTLSTDDLRPRIQGRPSAARRGDDWIVGATAWTKCQFAVQPLARVLLVSFSVAENSAADLFEVCLEQLSHDRLRSVKAFYYLEPGVERDRAALAIELGPGTVQIRLAFRNAADERELRLAGLRVEFLEPPPELENSPTGSVGLVYRSPEEIPGLLREMVEHHAHYRSTARKFSERWAARHNAPRLLRRLTQGDDSVPAAAASMAHRIAAEAAIFPIARRAA
ncbi:MAG TPA: hypothetical protein VFW87_14925 [Pirellulales bacterium]|nr:hypothetical protein [Pirellulales bacterium]